MVDRTFSVVAEAHLGLAEANGVFALRNAIEFLQFSLVNALVDFISVDCHEQHCLVSSYLAGKVKLEGFDADVLRS